MVIFGAGVLTGGLLVNYVDHSHPKNVRIAFGRQTRERQAANHDRNRSRADSHRPRLPEMLRQAIFCSSSTMNFKLTPEQHAAIRKIIAEGQEQQSRNLDERRPENAPGRGTGPATSARNLTPEQQKQFDELMKRSAPHRPPHDQHPPGSPSAADQYPAAAGRTPRRN